MAGHAAVEKSMMETSVLIVANLNQQLAGAVHVEQSMMEILF